MKRTKENGITLLALVITIIILIILAGISINLVLGENGIVEKTKAAKQETLIAQYKERIELIKAEIGIKNKGNIALDNLNEAFNEDIQKYWVNKTEMKNGAIILTTNDGYMFLITEGITQYEGKGDTIIPEVIFAETVEFTPEDSTWTGITNVKEALDYLYNKQ